SDKMRGFQKFAAAAVLTLGLIPAPTEAGWNPWARFFGECWSDGYHAPGDPWNRPPQARPLWQGHHGRMQSYFPPAILPHPVPGAVPVGNSTPTHAILEIVGD